MYDLNYGTINQILTTIFGLEKGINWLSQENAVFSIIFMCVLFGFGTSMLLYISAIKGVPSTYYEAAEMDGANSIQKFIYITVPSVSSITFYILVTGLIGCLQGFTVYHHVGGGACGNLYREGVFELYRRLLGARALRAYPSGYATGFVPSHRNAVLHLLRREQDGERDVPLDERFV
jgi:multiple sugar transport system permease protein